MTDGEKQMARLALREFAMLQQACSTLIHASGTLTALLAVNENLSEFERREIVNVRAEIQRVLAATDDMHGRTYAGDN